MATLADVNAQGVIGSRPAPAIAGRTYYSTDTGQIWYDTGTSWVNVSPAATAGLVAAIQDSAYVYAPDTGAANAYLMALSVAPTLVAGSQVLFMALHANTGASTLAVNGGAAVAIKKQGTVALAGGEIAAGQMIRLTYDGTNFQM